VKYWIFGSVAAAALMLCVGASPVSAEPPIGSRLGDRVDKQKVRDQRDAVQAAHQLAGCIAVKHASAAHGYLDSRDQKQVDKFGSQMGGEVDCISNITRNDLVDGVEVSYPTDIMRGDLAEEFLKRDIASVQQIQPLPIEKTYSRPWFKLTGRHPSVDEMAACVSNTNPAAIIALIKTQPFSDDENIAFSGLIPAMGPCLVAGATLDAKREPLRAALAEALYQRVTNPAENEISAAATAAGSKPN
jgi:hypothetical protein